IIIFGYKDYAVVNKKRIATSKNARRKLQTEAQQLSTFEAAQRTVSLVDSKYSPVCRRTLTSKVENLTMFQSQIQVKSNLLACDRFKGPHTAKRICEQFEAKYDEYSIKDKLDYICSDNASNMRKAFTVCFPIEQEDEVHDEEYLDDPELWNDLTLEDQQTVDSAIAKKQLIKNQLTAAYKHPAAVNTRWNSTLKQVKVFIQCDHLKLCHVLEKNGHKELLFTVQEWNKLKELVDILKQFGEATDLTQGEKIVTISSVVPSVLSLNHHLEQRKTQYGITAPFSDPVYLKAAALYPSFPLMWVEHHVLEEREDHSLGQEEGLFAAYCKRQKKAVGTTPALQLSHYLDICEGQNALLFWAMNRKALPSLSRVAIRVLAVPASSAPVERVFSHGGIILQPHRAQITDSLLSNLVFRKCSAS
uniref:HAT C-terminal dimerisation domain-containing protein n=1 Tax=Salmo trutta TaxID=8032 RepID=A0A673WXI8_SALTR